MVPLGPAVQLSGGEVFTPAQVFSGANAAPAASALLVSDIDIALSGPGTSNIPRSALELPSCPEPPDPALPSLPPPVPPPPSVLGALLLLEEQAATKTTATTNDDARGARRIG